MKKNLLEKVLYYLSNKFLDYYNNFSYNFDKNGELKLIKSLNVDSNSMIFDVGANEGKWSQNFRKIHSVGKIFAFEINTNLIKKIKKKKINSL